MNVITAILIALGLAADALAVSMSCGSIVKPLKPRNALLIASFFGAFQMIMPLVGWGLGLGFKSIVEGFDHWIAFILLAFVGGKMIKESFSTDEKNEIDPLKLKVLLILAIATSIDALAVGFSMSLVGNQLIIPILIIGAITFVLSYAGCYVGRAFGHLFETKVELAGGVILVGIGLKILIEHLSA